MFHLKLTKFIQMRFPFAVLRKIVGNSPGEQNVAGIAAVHHSLGQVDPGAGYIAAVVDIKHLIDRPAINAHAQ